VNQLAEIKQFMGIDTNVTAETMQCIQNGLYRKDEKLIERALAMGIIDNLMLIEKRKRIFEKFRECQKKYPERF